MEEFYLLSGEGDDFFVLADSEYSYSGSVNEEIEFSAGTQLFMAATVIAGEEIELGSASGMALSVLPGVINAGIALASLSYAQLLSGNTTDASVQFSSISGMDASAAVDVEAAQVTFDSRSILAMTGTVVIRSIRTPEHRIERFSIYD